MIYEIKQFFTGSAYNTHVAFDILGKKINFKIKVMGSLQFNTKLTSNTEIKIPEDIKSKIEINKEVKILVIPANEKLYDEWQDDEWNKLSTLLNEDEPKARF